MPIPYGDGAKGKEAIYGWEKQSRDEQAEIKAYLDREWSERHHRKVNCALCSRGLFVHISENSACCFQRVEKMGQSLREAGKCGDVETIRALLDAGAVRNLPTRLMGAPQYSASVWGYQVSLWMLRMESTTRLRFITLQGSFDYAVAHLLWDVRD